MIFIERDTALSEEEIEEKMQILREACDSGDNLIAKQAMRKRDIQHEVSGENPGNDGKPREYKGFDDSTKEKVRRV